MNQYRCETCKNMKPPLPGYCKTSRLCTKLGMHFEYPITGSCNEMWVITEVGCSSHSDFQNQREKQELPRRIKQKIFLQKLRGEP